jgi:hypothetical protein
MKMPGLNEHKQTDSELGKSLLNESKKAVTPVARYSFWSSPKVAKDFTISATIAGIMDIILDLVVELSSTTEKYLEKASSPTAILLKTIYWTLPLLIPFCRPSTCKRLKNTCAKFATADDKEEVGNMATKATQLVTALDKNPEFQKLQEQNSDLYKRVTELKQVTIDIAEQKIKEDKSEASSNIIPSLTFLALRALAGIIFIIAISSSTDENTRDKLEKASYGVSAAADGLFYLGGLLVSKLYNWWHAPPATPSPAPLRL